MLAGHDLLLVIIAIADGQLTFQLLQQFQAGSGLTAVCLLKNPEESYFIQFLNDQLLPVNESIRQGKPAFKLFGFIKL